MARGRTSSLGRAVLLGLVGALIAGGCVLAFTGWRLSVQGPDCAGLSSSECALEREISLGTGRRQTLFGAAMAVLGVALGAFLRLSPPAQNHEEENG